MLQDIPELSGYFISGSDTGVGKTWVSCQIIDQLKTRVSSLKVRKPVESGCELHNDNQLHPADGTALFKANGEIESLQLVTPLRFKAAVSPDKAAKIENQVIYLKQLQQAVCNNIKTGDTLLVEGAGGFYSPIAEDGLNADLARLLGLELILVIEDRLGAINQALLTIRAAESEEISIKAVILNQRHDNDGDNLGNLEALIERNRYPVYRCSYQGTLETLDF